MDTVQAIAHLKSGRTVKAEVLPNGGFRFTLPASEEVERLEYLQVQPTETRLPTMQPVRILPRRPVDRDDPTTWMRDRFGRLRRLIPAPIGTHMTRQAPDAQKGRSREQAHLSVRQATQSVNYNDRAYSNHGRLTEISGVRETVHKHLPRHAARQFARSVGVH